MHIGKSDLWFWERKMRVDERWWWETTNECNLVCKMAYWPVTLTSDLLTPIAYHFELPRSFPVPSFVSELCCGQTDKRTDSKILPTLTDIVGVGKNRKGSCDYWSHRYSCGRLFSLLASLRQNGYSYEMYVYYPTRCTPSVRPSTPYGIVTQMVDRTKLDVPVTISQDKYNLSCHLEVKRRSKVEVRKRHTVLWHEIRYYWLMAAQKSQTVFKLGENIASTKCLHTPISYTAEKLNVKKTRWTLLLPVCVWR